jgi:hypothetical protein
MSTCRKREHNYSLAQVSYITLDIHNYFHQQQLAYFEQWLHVSAHFGLHHPNRCITHVHWKRESPNKRVWRHHLKEAKARLQAAMPEKEARGEENKKDIHVCISASQTSDYMDQLVKETVEIKLHLNNINRKERF